MMKRILISILLLILTAFVFSVDNAAFLKGMQYYKDKKFLLAIGSFKAAVDAGIQDPKLFLYLGISYAANDDLDKALDNFKLAYESAADPATQGQVYFNMAYLFDIKKDYKQGLEYYQKAFSLSPALNRVFWMRGNDYYRLRDKTNTINQWEQYLTVAPTGPESDNIRKALALLKDPSFDFAKTNLLTGMGTGETGANGTNDAGTGAKSAPTVDSLIDIQGVLDTVKPADKGKVSDESLEGLEQ